MIPAAMFPIPEANSRRFSFAGIATLAMQLLLCFAMCTMLSCERAATSTPQGSKQLAGDQRVVPTTPPDQTYTTRGRIESLPGATAREVLAIHHEAIPDFINKRGEKSGMVEMIMDFRHAKPDVKFDGLQVGDAVEFTWEVRWASEPRTLIITIRKLPADTTLNLSPVSGPGK